MAGAIWRRRGALVEWLVDAVVAAPEGVPLLELVEAGSHVRDDRGWRASPKTVDNTVLDLCAFGAVRKVHQGREVRVVATVLGLAWRDGVVLPWLEERAVLAERGDELLGVADKELWR